MHRSSNYWSFFLYYFNRKKYFLDMNNLVDTMEGFFNNVSHSPNIDKITKLFNDWIKNEYDWDLGRVSTFTHYIPDPVLEFNPKKFIFSIYSKIFKYIRYDFQISDFIKDVMASVDNDSNYIFGIYDIYKDSLRISFEYKNGVAGANIRKSYTMKLISSPFAKMRDAFLGDEDKDGWIIDTMEQLEVANNKSQYKVEDIKKAIKEIYDLL